MNVRICRSFYFFHTETKEEVIGCLSDLVKEFSGITKLCKRYGLKLNEGKAVIDSIALSEPKAMNQSCVSSVASSIEPARSPASMLNPKYTRIRSKDRKALDIPPEDMSKDLAAYIKKKCK